MLSRRPELCQKLVTSEQWDTFLAKVPSLVDRPQLLTESDLAYVRGIATQAYSYRLPKDCFSKHIRMRIVRLQRLWPSSWIDEIQYIQMLTTEV